MKVSACIDMMFSYCDFCDRIFEAKKYGMDAIEFWKWSNKDIEKIVESNVDVSVFNIDSTDEKLSYDLSRGILNQGRTKEFLLALEESIPVYKKLNAKAMIVLIGENESFNFDNVYKVLNFAKPILEKEDVNLIVEPLNNIDRVGYCMPYALPVFEVLRSLNSPRVKMLYDIYHQNMMKDFDIELIEKNIDLIGHFHVADVPGRHEPGTGNVDYINIIKKINGMNYNGYIGLEYRSTKPDGETFDFLKEIEYV